MARSYKKTIGPTRNPRSHREWKAISNRRMRRYAKRQDLLRDEDHLFPVLREVSDVWVSPRDGIGNYPEITPRMLKTGESWGKWWYAHWWGYYFK